MSGNNANERERMARALFESEWKMPGTYPWHRQPKSTKDMFGRQADKLLAAGFGDVAQAKAEALEESAAAIGERLDALWEELADTDAPEYATISTLRDAITAHAAEYRTPNATGGGE